MLTARRGDAETGLLVSWVQQCSFQPPRISLALQPQRPINAWLEEGSYFTLNILDETQTDMVVHFGRGFRPGEPAFVGVDVSREGSAAPVLREALAFLDCRLVARYPVGDHDLLIAEVTAGQMLNEGQPMIHVRKSGLHY